MSIYVHLAFDIRVDLPEGDGEAQPNGEPQKKIRERAIEAAIGFLPQSGEICVDGVEDPPAKIWCEVSEDDVEEVRSE